jgi:DNA adenine methylase
MKVTAIAPWYGSNRMLAQRAGRLLGGCEWVGVPFAGGMCELAHIDARSILVSDLHAHVLNLAATIADPALNQQLRERLAGWPFHEAVLSACQLRCRQREARGLASWSGKPDLDWAADYFACAWMSRNATAGTDREFNAGLSVRWNASGGDSAVRFRHAAQSLAAWGRVMSRCTFVCLDVFAFLDRVHDQPRHGLYLDPPFPGPGDKYKHPFTEGKHRVLAARLGGFRKCCTVCRFYDHPLVRELYPEGAWEWVRLPGRTQTNAEAPEVLLRLQRGASGDGGL